MRKKINIKHFFQFIIIFLFGIYNISLYIQKELFYYIHPRYIWLTLTASIISLIVGLIGIMKSLMPQTKMQITHTHEHSEEKISWWDILVVFVIISGILIQPRQLSSATALQRSTSSNLQSSELNTNISIQSELFFKFDYSTLTIKDWANLMASNPNPEFYEDKDVHISGFIYQDTEQSKDFFYIARFVITCCAVDATPTKLSVKGPLPSGININDWVDIKGHFNIESKGSEKQIIVIPESINKIEQPDNPYVY